MTSNRKNLGTAGLVVGVFALFLASIRVAPLSAEGDDDPVSTAAGTENVAGLQRNAEKKFSLKSSSVPWKQVLDGLAEESGLTLDLPDDLPKGTFSYADETQYTLNRALDVLNGYLHDRGNHLVRRDRFLVVLNTTTRGWPASIARRITLDQLLSDDVGKYEIVSLTLPVPAEYRGPASVLADEILPLLGRWGKAVALQKANAIQLSDTGDNARAIVAFLDRLQAKQDKVTAQPPGRVRGPSSSGPAPPQGEAPREEKLVSFSFQNAPWKQVLNRFATVYGAKLELDELPSGTFNYLDQRKLTLEEALDILNSYLIRQGYYLYGPNNNLIVGTSLKNGVPDGLVARIPLSELPRRRANELVMVRIPLPPGMTGADAEAALTPLLGQWGRLTQLPGVSEILVRDIGSKVRSFVEAISNDKELLAALKLRYEDSERRSASLAAEYRGLRQKSDANDPKVVEMKSRLHEQVRETFERRQRAQRLEAEILRRQLRLVDDRLAERERSKDRIIDSRLQELIDPSVSWDSKNDTEAPAATGKKP